MLLLIPLATARPAKAGDDAEDLAREQDRVEKHLLRVQQERFEAKARGDDERSVRRLDREFKRTYGRRNAVIAEQKAAAEREAQ